VFLQGGSDQRENPQTMNSDEDEQDATFDVLNRNRHCLSEAAKQWHIELILPAIA
jgi:hypothetical protein